VTWLGLDAGAPFALVRTSGSPYLWRSDGTSAGTLPLRPTGTVPLNPATLPGPTTNERWIDGALYLNAITHAYGTELWRITFPSVKSTRFARRTITFSFSDDAAPAAPIAPILRNLDNNQTVPTDSITFNAATHQGTFAIAPSLPDGYYALTIPATSITDAHGNPMTDRFTYHFYITTPSAGDDTYQIRIDGGELLLYRGDAPDPMAMLAIPQLNAVIFNEAPGLDSIILHDPLPPQLGLDIAHLILNVPTTSSEKDSTVASLRLSISRGKITSSLLSNPNLTLGMSSTDTLITIKAALIGDLNLDGSVTIADFTTLAANFNSTAATWESGDLNYDDMVSIADFIDLAAHFNQSLFPAAPMAAASQQQVKPISDSHRVRRQRPHHRLLKKPKLPRRLSGLLFRPR